VIALSNKVAISVLASRLGVEKRSWIDEGGILNRIDELVSEEPDLNTSRMIVDCHSSSARKKFSFVWAGRPARYLHSVSLGYMQTYFELNLLLTPAKALAQFAHPLTDFSNPCRYLLAVPSRLKANRYNR